MDPALLYFCPSPLTLYGWTLVRPELRVKNSHSSRHYKIQKVILFVLHLYGGPGGVGGGDKYVGSTGVGGVSVLSCSLNFYFPSTNFDQKIQWKAELNSNITDISKF